jgi:transposase-like protein
MHAMTTPTKAADPETLEKPKRRHHSAEYKLKILGLTDDVTPSERSAVLRKHGLYGSLLTEWKRARAAGTLGAMTKKRGPKAEPRKSEFDQLSRENAKLRRKLEVAELIIDAQKKTSLLLGILLDPTDHLRKD